MTFGQVTRLENALSGGAAHRVLFLGALIEQHPQFFLFFVCAFDRLHIVGGKGECLEHL